MKLKKKFEFFLFSTYCEFRHTEESFGIIDIIFRPFCYILSRVPEPNYHSPLDKLVFELKTKSIHIEVTRMIYICIES